jgi:exoribonuclease-2
VSQANPTTQPGAAALLAVGGALIPVWVEASEGGKLRTVSQDGTCRMVTAARLYWVSDHRLGGPGELSSWFDDLSELASTVSLASHWDLLAHQGTGNVTVREVADLALGESIPRACDAIVVALFGASAYFKKNGANLGVRSREAVERAAREAQEAQEAQEALTVATGCIERALESGEPLSRGDERVEVCLRAIEAVALEGREASDFKKTMTWLEGFAPGPGEPEARARDLLVRLHVFAPDENLFIRRAGIVRDFSEEVLEAAAESLAGSYRQKGRLDLRHLTTVAVDDARTTEIDDAFALEGDRIVVFIADASAWIPQGGVLDAEAARRATTVYLVEGKIPMLPDVLCESAASLNAGVDRPALAFSFEIDEEGRVRGFEAAEAVCQVDERMTYSQVDEALAGGSPSRHQELLERVGAWMQAHKERRTESGALHLQRREVDLRVDDEGGLEVHPVDANGPGRTLVSELMVAACAGVAQWCVDQGVSVIYRSQSEPDTPPEPSMTLDDPASVVAVLRTLKPTQQGLRPGRHFTLGVDGYCQVTSPLRRYLDLVNHRQIKSSLRRRGPAHTDGEINGLIATSGEATGRARRAMSDTRRNWLLRYMSAHPDRQWRATVIRTLGKRWLAEIDELAFQVAFIPSGWVNPGKSVQLVVRKIDLETDVLRIDEVPRG